MKKKVVTMFLAVTMALSSFGAIIVSADTEGDVPVIRIANSKGSDSMTVWPTRIIQKMEEDLGVKIELVEVTEEQFDLSLASGSAPYDLANCTKYKEQQVLDANMAVNLDEYLDEHGQNIKKYEDRNNLTREFLSGGTGNLYFKRIQCGKEAAGNDLWNGYVVRWDWYKELGCPPINNDEDYLNVLQQMLEKHPENDAGGPTYGLGNYENGLWAWRIAKQGQNGFVPLVPGLLVDMKNGEAINVYTDERSDYWQAMEFFNKAYNKNLLDPDIFIMKSDDLEQKVNQGTYAGAVRTWDVGSYYAQEVKNDPETLKGYVSVFPEEGGMSGWYGASTVAGWENNSWFVYSGSENIEKAVEVLDYFDNEDNMRMGYSGFEGEQWTVGEDGQAAMTDAGYELYAKGGDELAELGVDASASGGWIHYLSALSGGELHSDGSPLNLTLTEDARYQTLNNVQKDYSDYFGVKYPAQVHEKQVAEGIASDRENEPKDLYMILNNTPSDMARIDTKLSTLLESYIPDLVTAATPEDFAAIREQVMEECKKAGSDELFAWAKENYETAQQRFDDAKAKYGIE